MNRPTKKKSIRTPQNNKCQCIMQYSEDCVKKDGLLPKTDFYMATSEMFKSEKLPICKKCIYKFVYGDDKLPNVGRFKYILRLCDYPFYSDLWKTSMEAKQETIAAYMKNVQLNRKNSNLTWADGDAGTEKLGKDDLIVVYTDEDDVKLMKEWGKGYTLEELHWLDESFREWTVNTGSVKDITTQKLIRRICITELKMRKADESNDNTKDLEKTYTNLMKEANLTPKDNKGDSENESLKAWGLFISEIEKVRPAEYFKDRAIYDDEDGILDYFKRFILRPMRNLLSGSRDFDSKYTIEPTAREGDLDFGIDEELEDV